MQSVAASGDIGAIPTETLLGSRKSEIHGHGYNCGDEKGMAPRRFLRLVQINECGTFHSQLHCLDTQSRKFLYFPTSSTKTTTEAETWQKKRD